MAGSIRPQIISIYNLDRKISQKQINTKCLNIYTYIVVQLDSKHRKNI